MGKRKSTHRKKGTKVSTKKQSEFPDLFKIKIEPSENFEFEILNYPNSFKILERLNSYFKNNDSQIDHLLKYLRQAKLIMALFNKKNWHEAFGGCYFLFKLKETEENIGFICISKLKPFLARNIDWTIYLYLFKNTKILNKHVGEASDTLINYMYNNFKISKTHIHAIPINIPSTELLKNLDLPVKSVKTQ